MLVGTEKAEDFKEVTEAEKNLIGANDERWTAPGEEFIQQCETVGAVYNRDTGFFELNGLTDIDEYNMRMIYRHTWPLIVSNYLDAACEYANIRTNLPFVDMTRAEIGYHATSMFRGSQVEVLNLECSINKSKPFRVVGYAAWIFQCYKLKKITGLVEFVDVCPHFNGFAPALEEINVYNLKKNITFQECPKLSLASFQYMVDHATNTAPITITVHADVYAKLTDESNTEWHQVLLDAAQKNINFATP